MRNCSCTGCLIYMCLAMVLSVFICHISPEKTYYWHAGIWHGLFVIPNWIASWFIHGVYCKAQHYTTAYNIWWWIVSVSQIFGFVFGGANGSRQ